MTNTKEPIISIIIPIYNIEQYLCESVGSVLSQSFQDYELILVDDGSSDGCPAICDEYAAIDSRITVIHKENGGLSDARNKGILAAQGKYILFIDADDFIAENSLIHLVETLITDGESDIVLLNIAHYYTDGFIKYFNTTFSKNMLYKKSHKEVLKYLTSMSDFSTSACLKLIKRDLLLSHDIFFRNVLWCEDTDFSTKLYIYAKTYNYCEAYLYYYRKGRVGSATFSFSDKKYDDLLSMIAYWCSEAQSNPDYIPFSAEIYNIIAFQFCLLITGYAKINLQHQKRQKVTTKKYSWLLGKTQNRQVLLVRLFYKLFGLQLTSIALVFYEKLRTILSKHNTKRNG